MVSASKLIDLYSIFLPNFHQSYFFHQIPCHQSYLSDLFHQIICQYYISIFWNAIFPVSKLLYHQVIYLHQFNNMIYFIKYVIFNHIYLTSFTRLFVNILYISLVSQIS